MIRRRTFTALASLSVLARSAAGQAQSQAWPARPIHIVCGFSVGTTTDLLARLLADRLGERLKNPVVVENRPGAGGNIAAAQVARAPADGHTLMLGSVALTMAPRLYKSVTFKPLEDFEPIGLVGVVPNVVLTGPAVSIASMAELIERARREPGRLRYASSGPGSGSWNAMKLLESRAGISLEEIPYASTAQATTDALGGQVDLHIPSLAGGMPLVRGGKLRPLGVTGARRSAGAPDIPAIAETLPGYDASAWYGLVGPAGLPKPVVQRLNDEMQLVVADPAVLETLRTAGVDVEAGSPDSMRLIMADPMRSGIDLMDRIGFVPQ
jgi:tripartite-type tricarboxylate transporter receptor subunit TctC